MSGFVYIWRDRKHNRFYIGSHWGAPDDGYVCSSTWMLAAYARRPEDFKRRIVAVVTASRDALLDEEYRWLKLIKADEIGVRYYNLMVHRFGHWTCCPSKTRTIGERISQMLRGKKLSEEHRRAIAEGNKGKVITEQHRRALAAANTGKKASEETRAKQAAAKLGKKRGPHSEEHKRRLSESNKGVKRSAETRARVAASQLGRKRGPHSEEHRRKLSEAHRRRHAEKKAARPCPF